MASRAKFGPRFCKRGVTDPGWNRSLKIRWGSFSRAQILLAVYNSYCHRPSSGIAQFLAGMVFHEFNSFTGRLKETMRFVPAMPIKPRLLHITEETGMMYDTINTKPLVVKSSAFSTGGEPKKYASRGIEKLMKTKAFFTEDFTRPTYIYAGPRDKMLFGVTVVMIGLGLLEGFRTLYTIGTKK